MLFYCKFSNSLLRQLMKRSLKILLKPFIAYENKYQSSEVITFLTMLTPSLNSRSYELQYIITTKISFQYQQWLFENVRTFQRSRKTSSCVKKSFILSQQSFCQGPLNCLNNSLLQGFFHLNVIMLHWKTTSMLTSFYLKGVWYCNINRTVDFHGIFYYQKLSVFTQLVVQMFFLSWGEENYKYEMCLRSEGDCILLFWKCILFSDFHFGSIRLYLLQKLLYFNLYEEPLKEYRSCWLWQVLIIPPNLYMHIFLFIFHGDSIFSPIFNKTMISTTV